MGVTAADLPRCAAVDEPRRLGDDSPLRMLLLALKKHLLTIWKQWLPEQDSNLRPFD
jgi:hypothetical protein